MRPSENASFTFHLCRPCPLPLSIRHPGLPLFRRLSRDTLLRVAAAVAMPADGTSITSERRLSSSCCPLSFSLGKYLVISQLESFHPHALSLSLPFPRGPSYNSQLSRSTTMSLRGGRLIYIVIHFPSSDSFPDTRRRQMAPTDEPGASVTSESWLGVNSGVKCFVIEAYPLTVPPRRVQGARLALTESPD